MITDNYVNLSNKKLVCIDFSKAPSVKKLILDLNYLAQIDVSNLPHLEYLNVSKNRLLKLDVSKNTKLKELYCNDNELIKLDVSKNLNLEKLNCTYNEITDIDVFNNPKLNYDTLHSITTDIIRGNNFKKEFSAKNKKDLINLAMIKFKSKKNNLKDYDDFQKYLSEALLELYKKDKTCYMMGLRNIFPKLEKYSYLTDFVVYLMKNVKGIEEEYIKFIQSEDI